MFHVVCLEVFNILDSDKCGQCSGPYECNVQHNLIQLLLWGDILLIPSCKAAKVSSHLRRRKVRQSRSQLCCSHKGAARGAGVAWAHNLLNRRWYILHYHRNTLLLPLRGEVVAVGGRVEERSKVIYWHRGDMVIYYR